MLDGMVLTEAEDAELAAVAALVNSAYRGDSSRQGWTTEADLLDDQRTDESRLRADLAAKPGARLLLLRDEADGPILACVWLEPVGEGRWYLGMLTVRPDLQDRQLGRTLLARAEAFVRQQGGQSIAMTVIHLRDTLIAWYQRRGYRPTGEMRPFTFADRPRDDLQFVVLEKRLDD